MDLALGRARMRHFQPAPRPRDSHVLFPTRLDEAIPSDHRVRTFATILDFPEFVESFDELARGYLLIEGRPPIHPRHLAALFLYGMMEGIRSSRRLEQAAANRIDCIWLLEGLTPDHSTIAGFVTRHAERLKELFRASIAIAARIGLVRLRHVAVDGTKIRANASKSSVKSEEQIQELLSASEKEAEQLFEEWKANETVDRSLFVDRDEARKACDAVSAKKEECEQLREALKAISRRQDETAAGNKSRPLASTTDPDARNMRDKEGLTRPAYNTQLATDAEAGIVVGVEVNDHADDSGMLRPMIEQVAENTGKTPESASADKAYNVGSDLQALEEAGVTTFVPEQGNGLPKTPEERAAVDAASRGESLTEEQWKALPKAQNGKASKHAFVYDKSTDSYRCPAGATLTLRKVQKETRRSSVSNRYEYRAEPSSCLGCAFAKYCTDQPQEGRLVTRDQFEGARERTRQRLRTPEGRATYGRRSHLAETPNSVLKISRGFNRFFRRGLVKVGIEAALMLAAYNLEKLMSEVRRRSLDLAAYVRGTSALRIDPG